jgi:hypothetical protein
MVVIQTVVFRVGLKNKKNKKAHPKNILDHLL